VPTLTWFTLLASFTLLPSYSPSSLRSTLLASFTLLAHPRLLAHPSPRSPLASQAILWFFLLKMYSERRRQQRDLQLERNFMAVTSHEVRNPLNGTVGWLRFLQDADELLPDARNMATRALECTQLALGFLQTLSLMYKLEAKELKPHPVATRLCDVVRRVATVVAPQMSDGVAFDAGTESLDDLPEVSCDGALLTHVLLNLLQNAARFTEQGHVSLVATVAQPAHDGHEAQGGGRVAVTFAVRDTGAGIQPSMKASLFSRYTSVGGVGIGLHLSNELVMALGSKLKVSSPWAPSGASGTSFEFTLSCGLACKTRSAADASAAVAPCAALAAPRTRAPPACVIPLVSPVARAAQGCGGLALLQGGLALLLLARHAAAAPGRAGAALRPRALLPKGASHAAAAAFHHAAAIAPVAPTCAGERGHAKHPRRATTAR